MKQIGFGYMGGISNIEITPDRMDIIRKLSKSNGKPTADRSIVVSVLGTDNAARYYKYTSGGCGIVETLTKVLGW